jgi:4-diphosphocytidyl-2-C-methyl-D-erythritol kinase
MSRSLKKNSHCKVNLLLNILSRRPDGFHELETLMHPVNLWDQIEITRRGSGLRLSCDDPRLPTDSNNLVTRAAEAFLQQAGISGSEGVSIRLEKKIPLAAGLGGGSGNAAATLMGLNDLFDQPLRPDQLLPIAASLGSDIPFFLQNQPALATGRGEQITPLNAFPCLSGAAFLLIHPGFGVSTAWAYRELARFPSALNGQPGRAQALADQLQRADLATASTGLYNSLESPVLEKYPLLLLYQQFLRAQAVPAVLMSGSGSTTFAIASCLNEATRLEQLVQAHFGPCWTASVPVEASAFS